MNDVEVLMAVTVAIATGVVAYPYRVMWQRFSIDMRTPSGFGALLSPLLLVSAFQAGSQSMLLAVTVITVATCMYWYDDFRGLNARTRFFIQFITGFAMAYAVLSASGGGWSLVVWAIGGGIANIFIVNAVNFYDGADLNLALFILLLSIGLLLFGPPDLRGSALVGIAFVLGFSLWNVSPRTLYLGDSGAMVFGSFLTMLMIRFIYAHSIPRLIIGVPALLPFCDVAMVFVLRLMRGEDLLSRNYHHLYQQLQIRYGGFFYLLPQLINAVLVLAVLFALRNQSAFVMGGAAILTTLTIYFTSYFSLLGGLGAPD
jgi:UDP-N-acetylmuramyl pentapeptide phosphotransferase/UDP-N-acetylglucosamine-1-phosphate transferase